MKRARLALAVATLQAAAFGCGAPAATRSPSQGPSTVRPGPAAASVEGEDFAADARLLYRIAACSGHEPLPPGLDPAILDAHCTWLQRKMSAYHSVYVREAESFFAGLRPPGLPTTVVYPFGGGDLLSALTTYPDATEITTISLELGGDPRRLRTLGNVELARGLARLRGCMDQLLTLDDSASDALMRVERGGIPGQLAFFLVSLAVHGYEPVSLRYFRLQPDGSIHYLDKEDIAAADTRKAQRLRRRPQARAPARDAARAVLSKGVLRRTPLNPRSRTRRAGSVVGSSGSLPRRGEGQGGGSPTPRGP